MSSSLYIQIARLVGAMVLVTALLILAVVWNNLSQTVHKNIFSGLTGAEYGYKRELGNFQANKIEKIKLMLENSAYIKALQSPEKAIQQQALLAMNEEVEATFVALNDSSLLNAHVVSNPNVILPKDVIEEMVNVAEKREASSFFYNLDGSLYWLMNAPAQQMGENKCVLVAYKFDSDIIDSLSDALGMRIAVTFNQNNPQLISSLDNVSIDQLERWQISDDYLDLFNPSVMFGLQSLYTKRIPVEGMKNDTAATYLTINAQRVSNNFITLQSTIALISLVAVALAIAVGVYLARKITRPLSNMVTYTEGIASGDYSQKLKFENVSSEFKALANAFDNMRRAIQEREATITEQTQIDTLTALYNRSYLRVIIEQKLGANIGFQAVGINIRGFRSINDVFGYEIGDGCLQLVAKRVKELSGVAARITGGEIIWLPDESYSRAALLTLQDELENDVVVRGVTINLKIVIGVLSLPQDATCAEDLYRRMNIVIDEAHSSKTFLLYYNEEQELRYLRRLSIISALKKAIEDDDGQLRLVYQPKVPLQNNQDNKLGDKVYLEALARWEHPELGHVSPDEFVSAAEHAGFINMLTRWVITTVVADICDMRQSAPDIKVAVNICADDVLDSSLLPFIENLLKKAGLKNSAILLELTERVIVRNPDTSIKRLRALNQAGFKIAIDDFGTGYSSLSYLTKLPIDILKIDQSFVYELHKNKEQQAICKTILSLAENLNIDVVAEGIEDDASLEVLTKLGCKWGQGYLICRPTAKAEIVAWITTWPKAH
ncbi:EAL domain-containing protein [Glaciecola siphonariae]|uniref:EAL domain-containing protein n=1 Tax=Glaciecola siphonariae TaxID=521012 RepID=A0ABV9LZK7_9ALTE